MDKRSITESVRVRRGGGGNDIEFGKIPPQNRDAEKAILGALMIEDAGIEDVVDVLSSDMFYVEAHQFIYEAIFNLYKKNSKADLITVTDELKKMGKLELVGGAYYLAQLTNQIGSAANVEYHSFIVKECFIARKLISFGTDTVRKAYEDETDVFELLDETSRGLSGITDSIKSNTTKDMVVSVTNELAEIEARMAKAEDGKVLGVPTGFRELDLTTGGWQKGNLIIIAARPSMGKTAAVLCLARNASKVGDVPVGFFSLEMSNSELTSRLMSAECEIRSDVIRSGRLSKDEYRRLTANMDELLNSKIYIDDEPAISIIELKSRARKMKQRYDIGLLVVDYLQLMSGTGKNKDSGNREQEISAISRGLKALAKELDIPVVALSQLSRATETRGGEKKPQLSDLRECLSLETSMIYTERGVTKNINRNLRLLSLDNTDISVKDSINIPKLKNKVYRLKTTTGRFVDCTLEHPILTDKGYKSIKDINKSEDKIAIAVNWCNGGRHIPDAMSIGMYLSELQFKLRLDVLLEDADEISIHNFMSGLFSLHTYYGQDDKKIKSQSSFITEDYNLAQKVLCLLAKIGVVALIQEVIVYETRAFKVYYPYGIDDNLNYEWRQSWQIKKDQNIYWDSIDSIEGLGEVEIFDRSVPSTNNFVVNGIIVHNSGAIEQDADIVIFIYRGEYYGMMTDADGMDCKGTGEFIIAKHRNGALKNVKVKFIPEYVKFTDLEYHNENPVYVEIPREPAKTFEEPQPQAGTRRLIPLKEAMGDGEQQGRISGGKSKDDDYVPF